LLTSRSRSFSSHSAVRVLRQRDSADNSSGFFRSIAVCSLLFPRKSTSDGRVLSICSNDCPPGSAR
jgi:hypothetical protein